MYIADNLVFQQKQTLQSQYYEHIWVDVRLNGNVFAITLCAVGASMKL